MSLLTTTEKISLDFYNPNLTVVNAKQGDLGTRFINITCTNHGVKVPINDEEVIAYIAGKKSDGKYIFNKAEIQKDGTITAELTSQILTVSGRHTFEIILLSNTVIEEEMLQQIENISELYKMSNVTVISVMPFYVNTVESIGVSILESTDENTALSDVLSTSVGLNQAITKAEEQRQQNEESRKCFIGSTEDTIDDGTVYGAYNSSTALYEEARTLVGQPTDESNQSTLYGIKQYMLNNESEREQVFNDLIQGEISDLLVHPDLSQTDEDADDFVKGKLFGYFSEDGEVIAKKLDATWLEPFEDGVIKEECIPESVVNQITALETENQALRTQIDELNSKINKNSTSSGKQIMTPNTSYTMEHDGYLQIYSKMDGHACYSHLYLGDGTDISTNVYGEDTDTIFFKKGMRVMITVTNSEKAGGYFVYLDE